MTEVLKSGYWSKSLAFLVPLTRLSRTQKYPMTSYLFWEKYSIVDNFLMLKFEYDNHDDFISYCRKVIFPVLDKEGYLLESHDYDGYTIFVLDMSIWTFDIQMFLDGKYSKMSKEAKKYIKEFHKYFEDGTMKLKIDIHAVIEPFSKFAVLDNMTAIDYVAEFYGMDLTELRKLGELGGRYDEKMETLVIKTDKITEKEEQV